MNIWRFTGNPENWITAIGLSKWALNENNKSLWESKIKAGDTVIFHSTRKSDFTNQAESVVIGFGYVGQPFYKKEERWWIQEIKDSENYWPYVVPLKELYLFSDTGEIDFEVPIQEKSEGQILSEIKILTKNGIKIADLNAQAKSVDNSLPSFPVNGSASGINEIYEKLILEEREEFYLRSEVQETQELEQKLAENLDDKLASFSEEELLVQARAFDNSQTPSHIIITATKKVRKENQKQKRRVAKIENYSCQVCGYKREYKKKNGKSGWIVEVDHIMEKAEGGNENLDNLWVLCPNCHVEKTRGIIRVDLEQKKVFRDEEEIEITDKHLFI